MIVHTYNSTYEIDLDARRIRRSETRQEIHQHALSDEGWHEFAEIWGPQPGQSMVILLTDGRSTVTSPVVAMETPAIQRRAEIDA